MEVKPGWCIPIAPGPLDPYRGTGAEARRLGLLPRRSESPKRIELQMVPPKEEAMMVLIHASKELARILGPRNHWAILLGEFVEEIRLEEY